MQLVIFTLRSYRRQLKISNWQSFLLPPPLLAADPVGREGETWQQFDSLLCCQHSALLCWELLISWVHCGEKLAGGHSTGLGPGGGLPTSTLHRIPSLPPTGLKLSPPIQTPLQIFNSFLGFHGSATHL